jgi:hypothetical protein
MPVSWQILRQCNWNTIQLCLWWKWLHVYSIFCRKLCLFFLYNKFYAMVCWTLACCFRNGHWTLLNYKQKCNLLFFSFKAESNLKVSNRFWWIHFLPKHWYRSARIYGVTFQKTIIFNVLRISNVTLVIKSKLIFKLGKFSRKEFFINHTASKGKQV